MNLRLWIYDASLALLISMTACGQHVDEKFDQPSSKPTERVLSASVGTTVGEAGSRLAVGGPCLPTDGWQPPESGPATVDVSKAPVVYGATQLKAIGWSDANEQPIGVGYCLAPGWNYPRGYFTMNCSVDSDCPGTAFCYSGQCRSECLSDGDCGSDMTCNGTPKAFCQGTSPKFSVR
jgi:hypothetical protein